MLALVEDRDLALAAIQSALDQQATFLSPWLLALDPRWDFMRDDERFNALAATVTDE